MGCADLDPRIQERNLIMEDNHDEKMFLLLKTCEEYPELYNRISNDLYNTFGIRGAEAALLCTYYVITEKGR